MGAENGHFEIVQALCMHNRGEEEGSTSTDSSAANSSATNSTSIKVATLGGANRSTNSTTPPPVVDIEAKSNRFATALSLSAMKGHSNVVSFLGRCCL